MVCLSDRRIQLSSVSVKLYTYTLYCEFSTTHTWCCCTAWRSGVARIWCQGGHDDWGAEGASIEAPNAPSGVVYGEGCPLPSRLEGLGSVVSSPSGVRGGAPAAIAFSAYFRPQNTSGSKKIRFSCPKYKEKLVFVIFHFEKSGGDSHHHFQKWWWQVTIVTYKVAPLRQLIHCRPTQLPILCQTGVGLPVKFVAMLCGWAVKIGMVYLSYFTCG